MPIVSSSWFIRGMPSVQTLSTWVSPRWNRAEPCAVGSRPTSAESGRMSVGPRPSMRMPSSTMRLRTIFFVYERAAARISRSRSGNSAASSATIASVASSRAALRSDLVVMAFAASQAVGPDGDDPLVDVVAVVDEERELDGVLGARLARRARAGARSTRGSRSSRPRGRSR